jgi:hypothetical protein
MTRRRGRCLKGQRLYGKAPFGHWLTQTVVAGLRCYGLTAPWASDPGPRRLDTVPAALQPRPQSHRNGLLKDQGAPARPRRAKPRRALASHRRHLRLGRTRRMPKLLRRSRLRIRLNVRCSSCCGSSDRQRLSCRLGRLMCWLIWRSRFSSSTISGKVANAFGTTKAAAHIHGGAGMVFVTR